MTNLTDEALMAYVDGELDAEAIARIEAALDDPDVRERVEEFRRTQFWIARAFDAPLREAVPERLLRAAMGETVPAAQRRAESVEAVAASARHSIGGSWKTILAASVALAVGVALGWHGLRPPSDGESLVATITGAVETTSPLHAALERSPSAEPVSWAGAEEGSRGEVRPILTLRAVDGRYCREFEVVTRGSGDTEVTAAAGVACRAADGTWRTEVLAAIAPPRAFGDGATYAPAAGVERDVIGDYLDGIMEEPALGPDVEAALLESGWK